MGEYSIIQQIGEGGMGSVYEAQTSSGERIALKKLNSFFASNVEYRELFNAEVASLRMMSHHNVVGIRGEVFADQEGNLYLPMEYIEGETIESYIRTYGPFEESEAIAMMCKILDAFSYIHSRNCIHRDVKPSNIMIRSNQEICVIDFGIAKDMKTSTGKTIGRVIGTDGYMSPEQAKGDSVDSRTDIYSLGCLLYYLICGVHAIKKKTNDYETICTILNDDFPSIKDHLSTVSASTEAVVQKAVNKNMLYRFQTVADFKNALLSLHNKQVKNTSVVQKKQISVGRQGCDINFLNEYVSGTHLTIEYRESTQNGEQRNCIIISDQSSNGTSVDGKYLHNEHLTLPFSFSSHSTLPKVYLAAKTECQLNWDEVYRLFENKYAMSRTTESSIAMPEADVTQSAPVKPQVGIIITSFLFPLIGWIYWWSNKKYSPENAKNASKAAWIGFIINLLFLLFQIFL